MTRALPPLYAVRAFEAAGHLGSFKAAATELHVTPGAISQQVRLLEDWIGAPLFERRNRRVVLTSAARAYLHEVEPLFGALAQATARCAGGAAPRTLAVNAPATFALRWLVPRLAQFRAANPNVDIVVETSNDSLDSLASAHDIVIRGGPDTFYGYEMRPFLEDERLPVCSPDVLAQSPLRTPDDLERHDWLHTASLPRLWPDWLAKVQRPSLQPSTSLTFDHFYLTLEAAINALGVAIAPLALIQDDLAEGRLVIPFDAPRLPSRVYCSYVPEHRSADPLVCAFRDWLANAGGAGCEVTDQPR